MCAGGVLAHPSRLSDCCCSPPGGRAGSSVCCGASSGTPALILLILPATSSGGVTLVQTGEVTATTGAGVYFEERRGILSSLWLLLQAQVMAAGSMPPGIFEALRDFNADLLAAQGPGGQLLLVQRLVELLKVGGRAGGRVRGWVNGWVKLAPALGGHAWPSMSGRGGRQG